MQAAFESVGIRPARALTQALIGPPLVDTLTALLRAQDASLLPDLIECFKHHYDQIGYLNTRVYAGVPHMLGALSRQGVHLYIATNKRIVPTRRIVNYLGWEDLFQGVYALDYWIPSLPSKAAMLNRVRNEVQTIERPVIYVGDRAEDAAAARTCGMPFVWVAWGYGQEKMSMGESNQITKPSQLLMFG
jgi:phosphoglycolate phosphatase